MVIFFIPLTITIAVVILFRFYAKYKLNYWKRRGVDSLPADLIFGNFKNAVLFKTAPGWYFGELYKAAKPTARVVFLYIFHKPCIIIKDPILIKQIMVRDFENFTDRHFGGSQERDSIGMRNLFGLNYPTWKYVRPKIAPTLSKGKVKLMLPLMIETGKPMIHFLDSEITNENGVKKVDAQEMNFKYATDLIASIALGTKFDSFQNPDSAFSKSVSQFFYCLKKMIALMIVFFMPEIVELFGTSVLYNINFAKKVFWNAIETREKSGTKRGDFLDSLIKLKNDQQNDDYKFEGENLFHQSATFFSGIESSSTATSFTLMELANYPECQQKAREDINKAIEKHGLTYEAFNDMKYLDQCLAEGLRLHPPISTIDRHTNRDYQIPGTDIVLEKGTAVYISLYGLQQDPQYFQDPLVFKPERFYDQRNISDAYFPFGIGPRTCVGMKVAQLHSKVVIAMILKTYEVTQLSTDKVRLNNRATFPAAANGINLQFKRI